MDRSVTREMAEMWSMVCIGHGVLLPVNTLKPGCFGYETPPGNPPVVIVNGEVVMDIFVTYNIEEVKRERKLD
jgi:hypothetical protein